MTNESGSATAPELSAVILQGIETFVTVHGERPTIVFLNRRDHAALMSLFESEIFSEPQKVWGLDITVDDRLDAPMLSGWVAMKLS